jgi:Zn-finger nucleic acid-binding protein
VHNDVDLESKYSFNLEDSTQNSTCPHCHIPLQSIDLKIKTHFHIKRCAHCFGLFLKLTEIEEILSERVISVEGINVKHIQAINKARYQTKKVKYIKCPYCATLMSHTSFAYRSGVIIDQCLQHGVWLDNGEITHLMEWKKAGGQLLAQQKKQSTHKKRPQKSSMLLDSPDFLSLF